MAQRPVDREPEQEQSFTVEVLWATYGALVIVAVIGVLSSHFGRGFENEIDAPARTLVATPVVIAASIVFAAALVALVAPAYRRPALRVCEIAGWIIPAWLVMSAMVLLAIQFALDHAD